MLIDLMLEITLGDLATFLTEEELRSYSDHVRDLTTYLIGVSEDDEIDAAKFFTFLTYANDFGYRLAAKRVPIEVLLRQSGKFRKALVKHMYQTNLECLQQGDVFNRILYVSDQITNYMNRMIMGYNRRQNEEMARAEELKRNQLLDNLPLGIVVYDDKGVCTFANSSIYSNNKLTVEEVIGKTRTELAAKYNTSKEPEGTWEKVMSGKRVKLRLESFGEEGLSLNEKEMIPLQDESGQINGMIAITYPSVSEKERLYHLQKQFSFVLNSMSSGLLVFNQDQVVTGYNKQAEDIFGLSADSVLGSSVHDMYDKYIDGNINQITRLIATMEKGIPISDLERSININGRNLTIRLFGNPIKNALNDPVGYILIIDDLTELLAMREAMVRNEKFALIGQFAAGIAHEIRNPLTTVFGFLQLYSKESIGHENFRELVSTLLIPELDRANTILSDFLMVSRPQAPQRLSLDTKTFLADVVRLIESEAHLRGVVLNVQAPEQLPNLNLDVQQMKQVFLNLCKNGFDVTPAGGSMTLAVRLEGKMVLFDVIDEGPGISAQDLSHIFEPFYTTKDNGTGLGLPISHRIIEGHGGTLKVSSTEGVGTTFTIAIPTTPYP